MVKAAVAISIFILMTSCEMTSSSIVTVSVRQGSTAILPCSVDYASSEVPAYVIEWLRHEQKMPVFIKIGKNPSQLEDTFQAWEAFYRSLLSERYDESGRMSIASLSPPTASLEFQNVSISDSGKYQCRVSYLRKKFVKTEEETWVVLKVTAPPSFIVTPPPTVQGRSGRSLLLRCIADGVPTPEVTWIKDGWTLKDGENDGMAVGNGEIHINSLDRSHAGRYTCMAKSLEGQVQHSTVVYVSGPPVFLIVPQDTTTRENQDVLFSCKARAYPDTITYKWFHNGISLTNSPDLQGRTKVLEDGTMVIYYVRMSDRGRVTCQASNGHGTPPQATARLIVEYRARVVNMPKFVYAGLSLPTTLTCPSLAEPPVTQVIWKKDGRDLAIHQDPRFFTNNNGSLVIRKVAQDDVGTYTCIPYNIHGTLGESQGTQLVLRDPPTFVNRPESNYLTGVGASFEAPCTGEGDPSPTVTWTKIGGDANDLSYCLVGGSLTIASVRKHHHGVWRCTLTNAVGQTSADITITVQNTTPQPVKNFTVMKVSDSSIQVTWVPGYDGGYPQHFRLWYKQTTDGDHIWKKKFIDGDRTTAVVSQLKSNTFYQLSLVPGNQEGSGPFSNTITVKTKEVRKPIVTTKPIQLPTPRDLTSSTLSNGQVLLSWRPLRYSSNLLGYLLEYRRIGKSPSSPGDDNPAAPSSAGSRGRRRRATDNLQINPPQWSTLQTTPPNVTTYALKPDEVYRDQIYEFQILAVTSAHYSKPSKPVKISTKGLVLYPCLTETPVPSYAALRHPTIIGIVCGILLFILVVLLLVIYRRKYRKRNLKESHKKEKEESISSNQFEVSDTTPGYDANELTSRSMIRSGDYSSHVGPHGDALYLPRDDVYVTLPVLNKYTESKQYDVEREGLLFHSSDESKEHDNEDQIKEEVRNDASVRLRRETAAKVLSAQREEWMKTVQGLRQIESTSNSNQTHSQQLQHQQRMQQPQHQQQQNQQRSDNIHRGFCRQLSDRGLPPRRVLFDDRRHPKMTSEENDESVFGVVQMTSPIKRSRCRTLPNRSLITTPTNNFDDVIAGCDVNGRVEEWSNQNVPLLSSSPMKPYVRHHPNTSSWQPRSRASYSFDYTREPQVRELRNKLNLEQDSTLEIDCSNSDIEVRFIKGLNSASPSSVKVGSNQMDKNNEQPSTLKATNASLENGNKAKLNGENRRQRVSLEALISPTHQQNKTRNPSTTPHRISVIKPSPDKSPDCFQATVLNNTGVCNIDDIGHGLNDNSMSVGDAYYKPTVISIGDIAWENVRKFGNSGSITSPNLSSQCSPNKVPNMTVMSSEVQPSLGNFLFDRDSQNKDKNRLLKNMSLPLITASTILETSFFPPIRTTAPSRRMRSLPTSPIKMMRSPTNVLNTTRASLQNVSIQTQNGGSESAALSPGLRPFSPNRVARSAHMESQSSGYGTQDTTQISPGLRGVNDRQRKDNSSVEENYEWDSTFAMESEILDALKNFETHSTATPISEKLRGELRKFTSDDEPTSSNHDLPRRISTNQNLAPYRSSSVDVLEQTEDEKRDDIEKRCSALRQEFLYFRQLQGYNKNP